MPLIEREDGLEVEAQQGLQTAERIVDNRKINREDRSELYLDLGPEGSNYPPPQRSAQT